MKLFSSNDRSLTHQKLSEVLAYPGNPFPAAFCQEDFNAVEVYEVHHGIGDLDSEGLSKAAEVIAALLA